MKKKIYTKILFLALLLTLAAASYLVTTSSYNQQHHQIKIDLQSKRREFFRDLYRNGGIIIYPASKSEYTNIYQSAANKIQGFFRRFKLKIEPDNLVTESELKNKSIFIIGTINSNSILKKLSGNLPVKLLNKSFEYHGVHYSNSNDIVSIFYKNPFNVNKMCYVISGNYDKYIASHINFSMIGDIRITQNGLCAAMGFSKINKNGSWVDDTSRYRNFLAERRIYNFGRRFRYIVYSKKLSLKDVKKIDSENREQLQKINKFFKGKLIDFNINYYLYDNFEDKGLISGNTQLSNIDWRDSSVHAVKTNWISGNDFSRIAELLLRGNLGKPKLQFLENGLAGYFSYNWRKKGIDFWSAYLTLSDNIPALGEMLNNKDIQYLSYLITKPLAASFISFLINKIGKVKFFKEYSTWEPGKNKINYLENEWKLYLKTKAKIYVEQVKKYKENFPGKIPIFQKGFCFAHVGYQIYNGYLSRDAFQSLKKIVSLGANSFSITPFTSMRNFHKPEPLRFWEFPGAENDESIIYLSHTARLLKLTSMLKPHIYLGESDWPGDIKMTNEHDWKLFFHNYYNWISHYAMIAEMYKIPILCIGNELAGATSRHRKEWIKMINRIRKLYDGKITYGANWSNEFDKIKFWNYLDYIGISEYYPLSKKNKPTNVDLKNGASSICNKISKVHQEYDKPVIFTEVGFRSSAQPWKTSFEGKERDSVNLKNQARCYNALLDECYNKKWLAGMYWWKWPSYLNWGIDSLNPGYTPINKPAQRVVQKWYEKAWKQ